MFKKASSDKIYATGLNLQQIRNEFLIDYKGDFESESMIIGPVEHKTNVRLRNIDNFEKDMNAIDVEYDSEGATFTGYVSKLNTHQFNVVKRSAYAKGTNCMQEIFEYHGKNCYIPTPAMCFIKCIIYFTDKDYTKNYQDFI